MSDFNETWIFVDILLKSLQISHFMKFRLVKAYVPCDGRTDIHDKANSRFLELSEST